MNDIKHGQERALITDKNGVKKHVWKGRQSIAAQQASRATGGFINRQAPKAAAPTSGLPVPDANNAVTVVEHSTGAKDYFENGICIEHAYPGIIYDTGLTISLAQSYNERTQRFQNAYSSYTGPAVSGAGRTPEFWLHGVKLRDQSSWMEAKKLPHDEFERLYGAARLPVLSTDERLERVQAMADVDG